MNERAGVAGIGMDKMEIRHMLLIANGQPLRAAIALSPEGTAIIVLDRHKQPRALEREIKEQVPGSRLHRFGTFTADEDDRKLGRFVLNRAAPGMARKLVKALKGSGLRRVEIALEDGEQAEAAEDVDGDSDVQEFDAGQRRADAETKARHVALSHALHVLAERIPGAAGTDHARRTELLRLAEAAQAELKRDRLELAEAGIAALARAIG